MNTADAFATDSTHPYALHCLREEDLPEWRLLQTPGVGQWLDTHTFKAGSGELLLYPGEDGVGGAVLGVHDPFDPLAYAMAPMLLPPVDWRIDAAMTAPARKALELGWGLGAYVFDRYKSAKRRPARLLVAQRDPETADILAACVRVRDLVNTPTEDMGPQQLEDITRAIAAAHGAQVTATTGDALLEANFPAIHAVGRASHRAPRLIELTWGDAAHPRLALVGKGVCFDTGGLDIKTAAGMRNMKKDMGGAAHALALAELIMAQRLPVRLQLLIPAVENAIGPNALRPGEIIATRKGLRVEIDNTDAEGRLVLCDALAYAGASTPDLLIDFATLTGAARIALGPDLPPLYCNDDVLADAWLLAARHVRDPLWRMPLWSPYLRYLNSPIADIANGSSSSHAGSVTAALFLSRFVPDGQPWCHLDVYAWNDSDRPGKPAGGEAQGLRTAWEVLKQRYAV